MLKIGLIREYKQPADRRVAFTPHQCVEIQKQFRDIALFVESSPDRAFSDREYAELGIPVIRSMETCDVLMGIKEVPISKLIPGKTYLFFSHTIKKQLHNRGMLQEILRKKITLIDYECLHHPNGNRVLGFGKYAGWVGTYEAFKSYGLRSGAFNLDPAYGYPNFEAVMQSLLSVKELIHAGQLKIALAGSGRVASGCEEVLRFLDIQKVTPGAFLQQNFEQTVYTLLDTFDLYRRKDGSPWDHAHFFAHHDAYESLFKPYTRQTDILINAIYWDHQMPPHFTKEETAASDFRIRTIADISCDVEGSVPITVKDTSMEDPVFGWNPATQTLCEPYTKHSIDIMAVSNLPSEIPADASEGFGNDLIQYVLPALADPENLMIRNATICKEGALCPGYHYLKDYVA